MGRPGRLLGVLVYRLVVILVCVWLVVFVAIGGVNLGHKATTDAVGTVKRSADLAVGSHVRDSRGGPTGTDAFDSISERRIPRGPDPIHNRRAGKTGVRPRRD